MACERPITLPNPKGGTFKAICGTCRSCMIEDVTDWSLRLKNENKRCFSAYFITLTYSDEHHDGNLHKEHIQEFFKNLRNNIRGIEAEKKIKYLAVGEYGEQTQRSHYHAIIFNIPETDPIRVKILISKSWKYGNILVGEVNDKTINYTCKYIFKQKGWKGERPRPFRLMSRRPGIGSDYIETHRDFHYTTGKFYFPDTGGTKKHLPRYYRKKIFDDELTEQYREHIETYVNEQHQRLINNDARTNVNLTKELLIGLNQKEDNFKKQASKKQKI